MLVYLLALVVILFAVLAAFGVPALMHLQGAKAVLFIVFVLLAGVAAAGAMVWPHGRARKEEEVEGGEGDSSEVDLLLQDASRQLRQSQQGAKNLDSIPLFYILGEGGSAKTTMLFRSGLEPQLLVGIAPRAGEAVPTPVFNLWYTRLAAFVDLGASIRDSDALLTRLVQRTRAKAYRSAFGGGAAPRAVIVCVSAELLLLPDGNPALMASAGKIGRQLREISRLIGTPVPVYVVITKLDQVPHFEEYVRNLSETEVGQLLGSPLPRSDASAGVYADQASRILSPVIDELCNRLAEFRMEMLDRETVRANSVGVYEFPREFAKLRKNLNKYLVEICKPSQLSVNPYLRGVYFVGARDQVVEHMASVPAVERPVIDDPSPTKYLNSSSRLSDVNSHPQPPRIVSSRARQWIFLSRLFPEVILGDRTALSATRHTSPARQFRRILFCAACVLLSVYIIFLIISFTNNHAIEVTIQSAATALPASPATSTVTPSLADLQNLDHLRQTIVQLEGYQQHGAPLTYHFGLYRGGELLIDARRIYFDRFRPMLLNSTQVNFVHTLRSLPATPASNSEAYAAAYNPLKAYLITTSNPDKSTSAFLTPVFLKYWIGSQQIDPLSQTLAQKQIDLYASELLRQPLYTITPDTIAVPQARAYLSLAEGGIYQEMLNDADKTNPAGIDFNKQYLGSAASITEGQVIRGAFTKIGFDFMQGAIQHPENYRGETWVLGTQTNWASDKLAGVSNDLATQYSNDYIDKWSLFLTDAHVVGCGGMHEAPGRLKTLAAPNSPLLAFFYTVSHNTDVANGTIKDTFQPTQVLVDPKATDRFIGPGNTYYVDALNTVAGALELVSQTPSAASDPNAFGPVNQAVSTATTTVNQRTGPAFNRDNQLQIGATVLNLLQAPFKCVSKLAPTPGASANGGGGKVCSAVTPLLKKLPISALRATASQASVAEFNAVFAPATGAIWSNYDSTLKPYLIPNGLGQYVAAPNAPQPPNPEFAKYFSRAAHVSSAFYTSGGRSPAFTFTLRFLPSPGIGSATLVVDGQRITSGSGPRQFQWNADTAQTASLVYDSNEVFSFQGPFSLFEVVRKADKATTQSGGGLRLDYPIDTSTTISGYKVGQSSGVPKTVSFEIDGPGAEILAPSFFSGLGCSLPVVKP